MNVLDNKYPLVIKADVLDNKYSLVIKTDNAKTIAVVCLEDITGVGIARCNPIDHYNEDIGVGIALARAIRHIAQQRERIWIERAKTKEQVILQRSKKKM